MEKLETLYNSISANKELHKLIYGVIFNNNFYSKEVSEPVANNAIKLSLIKYITLSLKEEIILKPKKQNYTNNLLCSAIDTLVDAIAYINSDGSVIVGSHIFPDANHLVAAIRNKFAHGDYYIQNDSEYVVFDFDGDKVPININDLIIFALKLYDKNQEYKITTNDIRQVTVFPVKGYKGNNDEIPDRTFKKTLDDFSTYLCEMNSTNDAIPKEAFIEFDKVYNTLLLEVKEYQEYANAVIKKRVDNKLRKFVRYYNLRSVMNNWGVTLSYKEIVLSEESKKNIMDTFKKIKCGMVTYDMVYNEILPYAVRNTLEDYSKIVDIRRCIELLECMNYMYKFNTGSFIPAAEHISYLIGRPILIDQDTLSMVQVSRLLDFCYLIENFGIEYDILPLDAVQPSIFNLEDNELNSVLEKIKGINKRIMDNEGLISKFNNNIENINNNMDNPKKIEILCKIKNNLEAVKKNQKQEKQLLNDKTIELNTMLNDRDNNRLFYYNKCLFERIRDSISHGNVYIYPNGEILNTIITFKDIFNGNVVFEASISLKELINMIDECTSILIEKEIKIIK